MKIYLLHIYLLISFSLFGQISNPNESIDIFHKFKVQYILVPKQISCIQVNELLLQNKGKLLPTNLLTVEPLDNYCWLSFELENDTENRTVFFRTDRSDIHYFEGFKVSNGKIDTLILSGDGRPFYQRPIKVSDLSFPIKLNPDEKTTVLVMLDKRGEELRMNFFLQNESEFNISVQNNYNFIFFYFGVIFFIFLFNIFLWINLKDRVHLIYLGLILSNLLFVISQSGLGFQYLWSNLLNKNSILNTLFTTLQFSFVFLFLIFFLNLKGKSRFYHFTKYYAWFLLLLLIPIFFIPTANGNSYVNFLINIRKVFYFLVTSNLLLLLAIIVEQIRKNNPFAIIYAISMSFFIIGGILYTLSIMGLNLWLRPTYIIFLGNLFELMVLSYGLTIRYNNFKKSNTELALDISNLQNNLSIKIIQSQETERKRLAQDLHDDLGGTLSAIKGKVANEIHNAETLKLVEKAIEDLRSISRNLLPPELAKNGLSKAIQQSIERLQSATKAERRPINFTFITFGNEKRMSEERELNIYRVISELLNNIIKHSKATNATIQVIFYEEYVHVSVEDNGVGIKKEEKNWGIGLKNVNSRIEFLKAKLLKDSNEYGTTFIIEVSYI